MRVDTGRFAHADQNMIKMLAKKYRMKFVPLERWFHAVIFLPFKSFVNYVPYSFQYIPRKIA